jgi:hypothetical protein
MKNIIPVYIFFSIPDIATPAPGFEPESEAPQASRISKLPHTGRAYDC